MSLRLAVGWLEARIWAGYRGDPDDLADWLEGNDDSLTTRVQERRRSLVLAGGGEIG